MGKTFDDKLFDLVCYMVVSARNLVHETKMYGPFRLIDACSRLISILGVDKESNEFLDGMKEEIEANKYKVMTDEEAFVAFLDDLVMKMVAKLEEGAIG